MAWTPNKAKIMLGDHMAWLHGQSPVLNQKAHADWQDQLPSPQSAHLQQKEGRQTPARSGHIPVRGRKQTQGLGRPPDGMPGALGRA